ncbi:Putative cell wall binding repeat 2 [Acididesulfobacillus acetoxydans]|uniref:Cell wall binding repeat 2 n=1 Tax=Acididesulfobacillus acetoxydans TaxID=1561005 RepID=A0A8S0VVR4_9FIRM|nr:cell wall-binding repeat-containing protein [Acididesulfobacillus acetoxydans]CAA7599993.1 Putative cell wall binding repeat 2 [Acididesulfobacillus acetoxydans]CEJ05980.1 Cell wall binding repeat 2-containing protein [Acididesulfobacillus acetoxydans]
MRRWFIGVFILLFFSLPSQVLAAEQSPTVSIQRIYGQDRYQTATAIADQLAKQFGINYSMGQKFQAVVLASGNNWPDAVSGTALANVNKAPILLLDKTTDAQGSQETFKYVHQHVSASGKVFILGGTGVVPIEFTQYLISMGFSPSNVQQIGGIDRAETSFMIAKTLNIHNFFLVSDQNFYDALSVAPHVSSNQDRTLLLVSSSGLTVKGEKEYLDGCSDVITVGDLSNSIASIYPRAYNPYAIGINGSEYETNARMVGSGFETAFIATGEDYPDALTGSVLAGSIGGYQGSPIIFVKHDSVAQESVHALEYIKTEPDGGSLRHVIVLGGTGAVSDNAVKQAIYLITGITVP